MVTAEQFDQMMKANNFDVLMGEKVVDISPGRVEVVFDTTVEKHSNRRGEVHGGALVAVSDSAMGAACFTLGKYISTLSISGNYVRPAKAGDSIRIVAEVEHNGRRTMVVECHFYNPKGKLVYIGKGTFYVRGSLTEDDIAQRLAESKENG